MGIPRHNRGDVSALKQKTLLRFLMIILVLSLFTLPASANSAEPPALIVILKNSPADAAVAVVSGDAVLEGRRSAVAWETYYVFYQYEVDPVNGVTLWISGGGESFELPVESRYFNSYNNIVTLDFNARTLTEGKLLSRSILLVGLRVTLTLLIEGVVFFLLGYREKRSWAVFLVMNLLTQGALNLSLNRYTPIAGYMMLNLIFMEFWVFTAEIIIALIFIREHGRGRSAGAVFLCNLLSLFLGGWLITNLPV